jgi:hypothetical protein
MTHHGVQELGPVDPASHARLLRNARRKNRGKAERASRLLDAEISLLGFEQDVVLHDHHQSHASDSGADGGTRRPHWRRGHFRRQPVGPARSERKLIFIRPVLVNAAHFHGDIADTQYRLRSEGKP